MTKYEVTFVVAMQKSIFFLFTIRLKKTRHVKKDKKIVITIRKIWLYEKSVNLEILRKKNHQVRGYYEGEIRVISFSSRLKRER